MNDYLVKLSAEHCTDFGISNSVDLAHIFDGEALDAKGLYVSRFSRIPNWIQLNGIDCKKANKWFVQNYQDKIIDCNYVKRYEKRKGIYFDDIYYFLFDDLLVYLNHNGSEIKILYRKTDSVLVDSIVNEIGKFKEKERKRRQKFEIALLVSTSFGLSTQSMEISKPKFSIEDNYNDDFLPIHQTILERLRKKNDKGLVLLHGKPGTGKTSYIRYLITQTRKPVIFLPPNMAASITLSFKK